MVDFNEYCAPGTTFTEERISITEQVALRVINFSGPMEKKGPDLVFVAGWVSLIEGWKEILLEMTKDFRVIYIETREKISSQIRGRHHRITPGHRGLKISPSRLHPT